MRKSYESQSVNLLPLTFNSCPSFWCTWDVLLLELICYRLLLTVSWTKR